MGKNKLDKIVKEKLYDLHTPIDTNDLWQNIESKMESDSETPVAGFSFRKYLGLGALALLLMGSVFLLQDNFSSSDLTLNGDQSSELINNDASTIVDASANIDATLNKIATDNSIISNQNKDNQSSTSKTKLTTNDTKNFKTETSQSSIQASKNRKNTIGLNTGVNNNRNNSSLDNNSKGNNSNASQNRLDTNTKTAENETLASSRTTNELATAANSSTGASNKATFENKDYSISKLKTNTNSATQVLATSNGEAPNSNTERSEKSQNAAAATINDDGSGGTTSNNIYESVEKENNRNTLPITLAETSETIDQNSSSSRNGYSQINSLYALDKVVNLKYDAEVKDVCENLKGDACSGMPMRLRNRVDCYDNWTADRSRISILPYIGLDFVTNHGSRADSMQNYLAERESTMKYLEVVKAGLLVKYNLTQNLYIKAGLEYDQIREKFEKTIVSTDVEFNPEAVIAYRITMEGDTTPVYGPGETIVIRTTEWKKYNKYHSFNVPVIIGYEAPISKRWDYFGEAGIFYNIKFSYDGTLLDTNADVVAGDNFFVNSTGVSLYGGAGVRFNANKRWSAFCTASYKYNLAPINNLAINPIKQNLGLAGIAIGAEIRL